MNKKKILGGLVVLTIAVVTAWNVNYGSQMKGMSDLSLENVEALAGCESPSDGGAGREVTMTCPMSGGGSYSLQGCDFDESYKDEYCIGRCANC
jgi:hypothetical protein